jgi:hypothetical protein
MEGSTVVAKITAGLTRKKPGQEQYSSDGYHLSVEVEADITTRGEFAERVHSLFAEVEAALDREISARSSHQTYPNARRDFWGGNGGNGGGHAGPPQQRNKSHASSSDGGNGQGGAQQTDGNGASASAKQIQYIFRLARRNGMTTQADLAQWVKENLGAAKTPYQMSRGEASKVIDLLGAKGATSQ